MAAYYNEFDPFAAAWLRELIRDGLIADGDVDTRSIADVAGSDLAGFTQCHFFAGIGGWSYALRLAGWSDDRAVWTGSCPCQPFSAAGKQRGAADERHLWPEFRRLIAECRPATVFGEQVASRLGRDWLAGVRADLEALGYGVGAADLCAAGVGAPHIRQRLYWCAQGLDHTASARHDGARQGTEGEAWDEARLRGPESRCTAGRLADAERDTGNTWRLTDIDGEGAGAPSTWSRAEPGRCSVSGGMGNAVSAGRPERRSFAGNGSSPWRGVLIPCADGKFRRVPANEAGEPEPSLFPLAHGVSNRVGTLRGAGNAIAPQVAAAFIQAVLTPEPGAGTVAA